MQPEELDARTWDGLEYLETIAGPGAIAEMVNDFIQDVPRRLLRMKTALADHDSVSLGRLAHDLKSNSATLGALPLSSLAARIEPMAGQASTDELTALLSEVESMLPAVLAALAAKAKNYPA
jgi:HPt (histidine-containing phosphotransfer) domain-containing protein